MVVLAVVLVRAWDLSRQLPAGDGWQLLAQQRAVGERDGAQLIEDQAALDAAWAALQLRSDPVTVDFGRSVVAWLTPHGTIACPTRLDEIRFDPAGGAVDGAFSFGLSIGCRSPSVNDSFLVALDRDRLPETSFELRMIGPEPTDFTTHQLEPRG